MKSSFGWLHSPLQGGKRFCVPCHDFLPAERCRSFTERRELREAWIARLSATEADEAKIRRALSTHSRKYICDAHFDEDAYQPGTAILKTNALPNGPASVKREAPEVQATDNNSRPTEIKLDESEPSTSESRHHSRGGPPVLEPAVSPAHPSTPISRPVVRRIVVKRRLTLPSSASSSCLNKKTLPSSLLPQEIKTKVDARSSWGKAILFGINPGCAFSCMLCSEDSPQLLACFPTDAKLEQKWLESISTDNRLLCRFKEAMRTGAYFRTLICVRHFRPRDLGLINGTFFRVFNAVPDREVRSVESTKRFIKEHNFPSSEVEPISKKLPGPPLLQREQSDDSTDGPSLNSLNSAANLPIDCTQANDVNSIKMQECVFCKDRVPANHSTSFTCGVNQGLWLASLSRDERERKRLEAAIDPSYHPSFKSRHFLCLRHFRLEDLELKNGRVVRSLSAIPNRKFRFFPSMVRSLAERLGMTPEFAETYCSHPGEGGVEQEGEVVSSPQESAGVQVSPHDQGGMEAPHAPQDEVKDGTAVDTPLFAASSALFADSTLSSVPKEEDIKEEEPW